MHRGWQWRKSSQVGKTIVPAGEVRLAKPMSDTEPALTEGAHFHNTACPITLPTSGRVFRPRPETKVGRPRPHNSDVRRSMETGKRVQSLLQSPPQACCDRDVAFQLQPIHDLYYAVDRGTGRDSP